MNYVVGIFFFGLTITMIVGKGILMSLEFAETELKRQGVGGQDGTYPEPSAAPDVPLT